MENKKLSYREVVNKQIECYHLENYLVDDLLSISETYELFQANANEDNPNEDDYTEYYQYYMIGDDEYYIEKIIKNRTLDILKIETQNDVYYFLCVPHLGISWDLVKTDFTEKDLKEDYL